MFRMITALTLGILCLASSAFTEQTERELYRLRIMNRTGGAVEVSNDGGGSYHRVGKVLRGATTTSRGFAASVYGEPGKVVATAVHGIRIKTGGQRDCEVEASQTLSIIPTEFTHAPNGFGGFTAGTSGIYTDIPTGVSIFRNLAPFVGNRVYRQSGPTLSPMLDGYYPGDGDILVVLCSIPTRYPREITVENKAGGAVKMVYSDAREVVAEVERPVRGTGRFDATGYTGVGRINTNHTGVLTISTASVHDGGKDGSSQETRGGFMIQPSRHAKSAPEINQVMVVRPVTTGGPWLEGMPPLFSGFLGLAYDPHDESNSFRVDLKTAKSVDWIPMPEIIGAHEDSLIHLPNNVGAVTDIRIKFPLFTPDWTSRTIQSEADTYMTMARARAVKNHITIISDEKLTLNVDASKLNEVGFVTLFIDGRLRSSTNAPPYSFTLSTKDLEPGDHTALIRAMSKGGSLQKEVTRQFFVN